MSWFKLKPSDFPLGEPVLKMKVGYWYRPNNCGYTDRIYDAGFYERDEAIKYCFNSDGKNGKCDVLAVPIREALRNSGLRKSRIAEIRRNLDLLERYSEDA